MHLSRWGRLLVAVLLGLILALPGTGAGTVAAVLAGWSTASGLTVRQRPPVDETSPSPADPNGETFAQKHDALDGSLALVARAAAGWTRAPALDVARRRSVAVDNGRVRVVVESAGPRAAAEAAVRAVGGTVEAAYEDLVQALVAPDKLEPLAAEPAVRYVRRPKQPRPDAVTSEGVAGSMANTWHQAGFTGQNVKIGIVDVGFTNYQARQSGGDLPAGGNLVTRDICNGNLATGGDHGTAVAEIVYDMAPGAQIHLICVDTEVQLGMAKDYAKQNGLSVIVMSLSWFNTSRGDGTGSASSPNATVADARVSGILWVNSAGNRAEQHFSALFNDSDGNEFHNYGAQDNGLTVFVPAGGEICAFLRWDAWPTTDQDLDLWIRPSPSDPSVDFLRKSETRQTGTQAPTETACYTNTGQAKDVAIAVRKFKATTNPFFDIFVDGGFFLEYQVPASSVTEPGSSQYSFTVGAICWQNSRLEDYSSQGPTIDGRIKPDIAGQSVVSTATYPGPVSCPATEIGSGGFNGTSAATPHVGGAAALVKSALPSYGPDEIQAFLERRAVDLGPPGKDPKFGAGRLALGAAPPSCSPTRPKVEITTTVDDGRLMVTVKAAPNGNELVSIAFGNGARTLVNALIDLPDGRTGLTGTPTWTATGGTTQMTFSVKRQTAGADIFVPFVVTDFCGAWPTFVGGGNGATGF